MSDRRKSAAPKGSPGYQPRASSSASTYVLVGVGAVVILALVVGGILWNSSRDPERADEAVLSENAALIIGTPSAPLTIDVFEDFMCPYCRTFEQQSAPAIATAIGNDSLRVRYHLLTFLNRQSSSGNYSSRAAGAAQCVGEAENRDVFLRFHAALFEDQPEEGGSSDHSNADLARIAGEQGASAATQQCIADGARVEQADAAAKQSQTQLSKATGGQAATPTVLSGGEPVDGIMDGTAWLDQLLATTD